jgi:NADH-quinone oxidoreductase subunit G
MMSMPSSIAVVRKLLISTIWTILLPIYRSSPQGLKIPRQSHRYSGRTAMIANLNVHEPKQPIDDESVMAFSMEGMPAMKDASILGTTWAPSWNSNQSISKFQEEVNGELKQGHTGTRLINDKSDGGSFFEPALNPPGSSDQLTLSWAFQIFGSDELSARSSAIQERMTDAYVGLSPADAERLEIRQGQPVSIDGAATAIACVREQVAEGNCIVYCGEQLNPNDFGSAVAIAKSDGSAGDRGIAGLIVSDLLEESY